MTSARDSTYYVHSLQIVRVISTIVQHYVIYVHVIMARRENKMQLRYHIELSHVLVNMSLYQSTFPIIMQ